MVAGETDGTIIRLYSNYRPFEQCGRNSSKLIFVFGDFCVQEMQSFSIEWLCQDLWILAIVIITFQFGVFLAFWDAGLRNFPEVSPWRFRRV